MVEILLLIWISCLVFSVPLTIWNIHSVLKVARSEEVAILNENLKPFKLYWSLSQDDFIPIESLSPADDLRKAVINFVLLGLLGFFSIIGLVILFVVSLSLHFFIRNRRVENVFKSNLSRIRNLDPNEAQSLLISFGWKDKGMVSRDFPNP